MAGEVPKAAASERVLQRAVLRRLMQRHVNDLLDQSFGLTGPSANPGSIFLNALNSLLGKASPPQANRLVPQRSSRAMSRLRMPVAANSAILDRSTSRAGVERPCGPALQQHAVAV